MLLSQLVSEFGFDIDSDAEITGITDKIDEVGPGNIFVCIKGARFDGHTNARAAYGKGAAAFVAQYDTGLPNQLVFDNSREGYALLSAAFCGYPSRKLKIIGVTGTNGKTSTALMLKQILDKCGIRSGLIGTAKNMIGDREYEAKLTTPEYLDLQKLFADMADAGCEYCVMEVSSQALAQKRVAGTFFETGIFTNLTRDHLDYHGTMENYAAAKAELFRMCRKGIINADSDYAEYMLSKAECETVTFGVNADADIKASDIGLRNDGVSYRVSGVGDGFTAEIPVPGDFTVYNSLGAIAAAYANGISPADIARAVKEISGVKGRIEVVPVDKPYTVIIDYAHTPDGLENILSSVRKFARGRILTVFGCGGDRDATKRPIMGKIGAEMSDIAFVTSDNPRTEDPLKIIEAILSGIGNKENVRVNPDRKSAIRDAMNEAREGDIVLLAGKGHETYQMLSTGKIHFDEREVVAAIAADHNV